MSGVERFSRQEALKEIGASGQVRLAKTCLAVVGVGALGTVAAELLVRAGAGKLLLVDRDFVELHNLQRQLLYSEGDVGTLKALAAEKRLKSVNSSTELVPVIESVSSETAGEALKGAGIVLDCSDNFETRFALNSYCVSNGLPLVYGSAVSTYGYVFSVVPGKTPCLECIYKNSLKDCDLPACSEVGVLNAATSVVGSVQASEALKLVLGAKTEERLQFFDLWNNSFEKIQVKRKKDCGVCG
ncbi:MAG TPA: HesA/MoeB/ThiF family protein [archaeon]|nr:HesA/MoeB/ThiF family protein [archaeon]